jgi:hypothetical protein
MIVYMRPRWSRQIRARRKKRLKAKQEATPNNPTIGARPSRAASLGLHDDDPAAVNEKSAGDLRGDKLGQSQDDVDVMEYVEEAKEEEGFIAGDEQGQKALESTNPSSVASDPTSIIHDQSVSPLSPSIFNTEADGNVVMSRLSFYDVEMDPSVAIATAGRFGDSI